MPIVDLYKHSESRKNLAHFAAMASLAAVDGEINPDERSILDHFAEKLGITEAEYKEVMKKENKYPIETPLTMKERLERLAEERNPLYADLADIDFPARNRSPDTAAQALADLIRAHCAADGPKLAFLRPERASH